MNKIVELETLRRKKKVKSNLDIQANFKMLYNIDLDENQLAQKLRSDKRKEKELEWD